MLNLVRKELVEHGWVLLLVLPLSFLGFLLALAAGSLQESGSPLDAVRFFGLSVFILLEMVICNRLVVQEYSNKTQLFLEGLPISRTAMLLTKYMIGIGTVGLVMAACFAVALMAASRSDNLDRGFVGLMAARLVVYVLCTFSFFFMMGLLGRYRIAIYLALLMMWTILGQQTEFDSQEHTPFGLLSDRFAFERVVMPVRLLTISAVSGACFLAASLLMGLMREGTVAGLMAERMSHREKMFLAAILLSMLMAGTILDEKKRPEPYSIAGAATRNSNGVSVQIEKASREPTVLAAGIREAVPIEKTGEDHAAEVIADQLHGDLVAITDYLNVLSPPELFVVNRRDLDADRFEPARLENADGVLVRVNYTSPAWSLDEFRPFLIDGWLSHATRFQGIHEPRCWVLEGFSEYWPRSTRDVVGAESPDNGDATDWNPALKVDLRAAYGAARGFDIHDMDDWYRFRERLGQPIVRSVACSALVFAEQEYGKEKLQAFLREMLGGEATGDGRADVDLWRRPVAKVWRETMGSDYREFQSAWAAELNRLAKQWQTTLVELPVLSADEQFVAKSDLSFALQVNVEAESLPPSAPINLRYQTISAFDQWEDDLETQSQIQTYDSQHDPQQPIVVDRLFSLGERLRYTASTRVEELGCDVISSWQRRQVK